MRPTTQKLIADSCGRYTAADAVWIDALPDGERRRLSSLAMCRRCDDTGWAPVTADGRAHVERCTCWWDRLGQQHLREARIPPKYRHCTLENFNTYDHPPLVLALHTVRTYVGAFPVTPPAAGAKGGVFLQGPPGVGKSHLAAAAVQEIIATTKAWALFSAKSATSLRVIRDSYNPSTQTTETAILRPVLRCDLLVLDDLGAEKTTEWVEETMNYIVNERYSECRKTYFTSNYLNPPDGIEDNLDTFKARVGERMYSRLREMCEFVDMHGADYRERPPNHTDADLQRMAKTRPAKSMPRQIGRGIRAHLKGDGKADLKCFRGPRGHPAQRAASERTRSLRRHPDRPSPCSAVRSDRDTPDGCTGPSSWWPRCR